MSFEKSLEELQAIVKRLESGELSLEDSLKAFESGVQLVRQCQEVLTSAEKRVQLLSQNSTLEPFGSSAE
jgi:exodeoxyribonuclease VII small subunit